jgi:radical SAM protein with 4Fe4S-binding SPASM domain
VNLLASSGVSLLKTNPVCDSGDWLKNHADNELSTDELFETYLEYIPLFFKDGSPLEIQLGGFFIAEKGATQFILPSVHFDGSEIAGKQAVCGHARNVMYISAEGRILTCISISGLEFQKKFPLVTEAGLVKCLTDSAYMSLISTTVDELLAQNEECRNCEHKYYCCAGCRALAYLNDGDIMGPDRTSCKIFKDGYIPRIFEAAKGYECVNYKLPVAGA